jgi:hypothetical protein
MVLAPFFALAVAFGPGFEEAAKNQPRRDAYGDLLPPAAVARLGTIRFRHGARVAALDYSYDGKLLASGAHDGTVTVWDAASGKRLKQFAVKHHPQVDYVAFLPGDKQLLSVCRRLPALLWDLESGRCLREIGSSSKKLSWKASLSPDGKLLACADTVLEVATGKEYLRLKGGSDNVAFSPDGRFLASFGRPKRPAGKPLSSSLLPRKIKREPGPVSILENRLQRRIFAAQKSRRDSGQPSLQKAGRQC